MIEIRHDAAAHRFTAEVEGRQAVLDYRTQQRIDAPIHQVDRSGVWWRKPAM